MGKSAPRAPDPTATANAQMGFSQEAANAQARMNRPNTRTPFGTVTVNRVADPTAFDESAYLAANPDVAAFIRAHGGSARQHFQNFGRAEGREGGGFREEVVTTLDPNLEAAAQAGFGRIRSTMEAEPQWQRLSGNDFSEDRRRVEEAIMSRLNPQLDRDRATLENGLIARGFQPGTVGFQQAMDQANRAATDARMQAILAGGQEQSRLFGLDMSRAGFNNALTQQQRQLPFSEIGALFGLQPQMAQVPQVGVAAPNFQQLVSDNYAQQVAAVNAQNQATSQLIGALLGAGARVMAPGARP